MSDPTQYWVKDLSVHVEYRDAAVTRVGDSNERTVNQYSLTEVVGKGSFAEVFRAFGPSSQHRNSIFGVKVINKKALQRKREWRKSSDSRNGAPVLVSLFDKVEREVDIWQRLRCPNIIGLREILDDASPAGSLYLVTEFAEHGQIMQWNDQLKRYTCPRIEEGTNSLQPELCRHYFRDIMVHTFIYCV